MAETQNLWSQILKEIKQQVEPQTFSTWFDKTEEFSLVNDTLTIKAPTKFFADWLDQHYKSFIEEIAYNLTAEKIVVDFIGSTNNAPNNYSFSKSSKFDVSLDTGLNPRYTFGRFVVGNNNHFAFSAAQAVADKPGKIYNPLFIYGGVGLGKTHLMQGVGNSIVNNKINKKVLYITTEDFTNEMISAIQTNSTINFRKKFRTFDILMIDDIHFLAGKEGSQEEFFHTFNTLYNAKKQIILTSDRPPKEIKQLQDRLISRFEWGLLADIKRPNYETRVAILRQKCDEEDITLKDEILEFIAENFDDNIRQLEGSLVKILAFSSYKNIKPHQIEVTDVKKILEDMMANRKRPVTLDLIQEEVAKYFEIGKNQIKEPTRKKEIAFPRQIAMYLSAKLIPHISLLEIANHYNKKDHTTIIHAKKIITQKLGKDQNLKSKINEITEAITK
ncbi:MAG TPA: chromosomal replication initiator protein DnaA [Candidatus Cloacimonetes bacterium]|nr:chromosomal replication initiator protein DnaA [Candidatus Cloacimonadota bacterium]